MSYRSISDCELRIERESDLVDVRQKTKELALKIGFDSFAIAAVVTGASELSRNVWVHGSGGSARIAIITNGAQMGLRLDFEDQGPGIADIERAIAGGNSTIKSLGLGLAGTRRLMDEFNLESAPGLGTKVSVVKWKKLY